MSIAEIAAAIVGEALGMAWENSGSNEGESWGHSTYLRSRTTQVASSVSMRTVVTELHGEHVARSA